LTISIVTTLQAMCDYSLSGYIADCVGLCITILGKLCVSRAS